MRYSRIPDETIRRLPIYLRGLILASEQDQKNISSTNLADYVGIFPWQIRKDFSYFGDFGTRGVGYNVVKLMKEIKRILKLNIDQKAALVGVGNLGMAILAFPGFGIYGLDIAAAFDVNPKIIGRKIKNITIENISRLSGIKKRKIKLAVIAVPRKAAQETVDVLIKAGVRGILNFSPCYLIVPKKVKVITIDISMDMARLPYYMPAS
ncbi:MAG: redox-sensing transcriptional repressor Rex [Planctomycetes bacterium]|nr:redox-sensing transcriptional repressor Rex [Planctomycetota bacterium]MBL7143875.1 redox-sensing transcriptional repressor Rex [Phycisphaerae bacterium]